MTSHADRHAIIVGIDGSGEGAKTARWAASVAAGERAQLVVIRAVPSIGYHLTAAARAEAVLIDEIRNSAQADVDATIGSLERAEPGLDIVGRVAEGPAGRVLVEASESARLVVVGRSRFDRAGTVLLGSTAQYVTHKATCPVAVWRGVGRAESLDDRPVVVGVDGSPNSDRAIGEAMEFASITGATVVAVHTWTSEFLLRWSIIPEGWTAVAEMEETLLAESLAGWSEKYPDVKVERVATQAEPAAALIEHSRTAQVLVVGSRGHNRVTGLLLGSTSQNLLFNSYCPVVVCRNAED